MIRLSLLALTLTATPALAEGILLPPGFDGIYAPEGLDCAAELARITVAEGTMVGAEFAITVTDIVEDPVNPVKVEATMLNAGGGGEWTDSAVLELVEAGARLRFTYPDGMVVDWLRCG